ncbi:hypothetical protein CEXT_504321 [Caerostris extrusa]|uniref:Uncharacterized protein n=1 Tax=Caerostris extrusa TaxID=172846 RepID=A0AAV4SDN5_CAEEX|nr:hypothetical protein CEXT_504321 [Caerostris extrusa]
MKNDFATHLPSLATSHRNLVLVPGCRRCHGSDLFVESPHRDITALFRRVLMYVMGAWNPLQECHLKQTDHPTIGIAVDM